MITKRAQKRAKENLEKRNRLVKGMGLDKKYELKTANKDKRSQIIKKANTELREEIKRQKKELHETRNNTLRFLCNIKNEINKVEPESFCDLTAKGIRKQKLLNKFLRENDLKYKIENTFNTVINSGIKQIFTDLHKKANKKISKAELNKFINSALRDYFHRFAKAHEIVRDDIKEKYIDSIPKVAIHDIIPQGVSEKDGKKPIIEDVENLEILDLPARDAYDLMSNPTKIIER